MNEKPNEESSDIMLLRDILLIIFVYIAIEVSYFLGGVFLFNWYYDSTE